MAKKGGYKFKSENSEKNLFEFKISDSAVKELQHNANFTVNTKQRVIKSPLFDKMFNSDMDIYTLKSNNYSCTMCNKRDSFLVNEGKVYCLHCYTLTPNNLLSIKVDNSLFSNVETPDFNITKYDGFSIQEKEKTSKKKKTEHKGHADKVMEMLQNLEEDITTSKRKTSQLDKFERALQKSATRQKRLSSKKKSKKEVKQTKQEVNMKQLYHSSCFNHIMDEISSFEERLSAFQRKNVFDIVSINNILNIVSPTIKKIKVGVKVNSSETNTQRVLNRVVENKPNVNAVNKFLKTLDNKSYVQHFYDLNDNDDLTPYADMIFGHEKNCQGCNKQLSNSNYHSLVKRADITFKNTTMIISLCDECVDSYNNISVLEVCAERELMGLNSVPSNTVIKTHLITQFNYLQKKVNTLMKKEEYKNLMKDYQVFYSLYLHDLLHRFGLSDNKYYNNNVCNIIFIKEVISDLKEKIA